MLIKKLPSRVIAWYSDCIYWYISILCYPCSLAWVVGCFILFPLPFSLVGGERVGVWLGQALGVETLCSFTVRRGYHCFKFYSFSSRIESKIGKCCLLSCWILLFSSIRKSQLFFPVSCLFLNFFLSSSFVYNLVINLLLMQSASKLCHQCLILFLTKIAEFDIMLVKLYITLQR